MLVSHFPVYMEPNLEPPRWSVENCESRLQYCVRLNTLCLFVVVTAETGSIFKIAVLLDGCPVSDEGGDASLARMV
jgi:hypothetical protein